jgi:predicted nucleotidyltransferase
MPSAGILDLPVNDLQIVQHILDNLAPGRPVFLFGSRVTGRARRRSDLDLAIGGETPLGRRIMADLREAFVVSDLPIEVDVVDLAETTGIFRARIESEWIPLSIAAEQLALKVSA